MIGSRRRKVFLAIVLAVFSPVVLFVANGLWPNWQDPEYGETSNSPVPTNDLDEITVMAFNIAKASFHRGGIQFASEEDVRTNLDALAAIVRAANPHVVCLSEIVYECGPCPVNQVRYLAEACGMHAFAYGDNYSFGFPFYEIRSGNAILTRMPLKALRVEQLRGGKPFFNPTNNRRILWGQLKLGQQSIEVASVRNDSFDLVNNARQARQILDGLDSAALLAGDFNAEPQDDSMRHFRESGRFVAAWESDPTSPNIGPTRAIDFILAPASWTLLEHRVVDGGPSDHRAVISRFRLP